MEIRKKQINGNRIVLWVALAVSIFLAAASISIAKAAERPLVIKVTADQVQPVNTKVTLTVAISGGSAPYKEVLWASGKRTKGYFKNTGKKLSQTDGRAVTTVEKNGTYTFYVKDSDGKTAADIIKIKNIDTEGPMVSIKKSTYDYTNQSLKVQVTAVDKISGVDKVLYQSGKKQIRDFKAKGKKVALKDGRGSFKVTKNGSYTVYISDKVGNSLAQTVTVSNIDTEAPEISAHYSVMKQTATVSVHAEDKDSGVATVKYLKGSYNKDSAKWKSDGKVIPNKKSFKAKKSGTYSILVTDSAGNASVEKLSIQMELKAVWISYLEFMKSKGYSEKNFQKYFDNILNECLKMNMNTVIVQVRPYGDSMYESDYFPWSVYASNKQGEDPGYDPLEYMVRAAHKKGLSIHAWINPYRVSSQSSLSALSSDNPARLWRKDEDTKRYVLTYGGKLYYNPSISAVQKLIVNGVKELVERYEVDGIHFDDYFYPSLGSNYKNNFDAVEYKAYLKKCSQNGTDAKDIVSWRRGNVNTLVKKVYQTIKEENPSCIFGISPAGNISNLLSKSSYYVDIKKWLGTTGYVDYICPQIYWGFSHKTAPYEDVVDQWLDIRTSDTVNMYLGLAAYKCGTKSSVDPDWSKKTTVLRDQVLYGRDTELVDGFIFFRYDSMLLSKNKKEVANVVSSLEKK